MIDLKLHGAERLAAQFKIEDEKITKTIAEAMARFAGEIEADSVALTPVRIGELRKRAYVSGPEHDPKTHQHMVIIGYERESDQQKFKRLYAVPVHERTYAHHEIGQAKFLETAVKRRAGEYLDYMARKIREELNG